MSRGLPAIVIGSHYSEAAHRQAAERFVYYAQSERAVPALRRWGPWSRTAEGVGVMAQLTALADELLCADITSAEYEHTLLGLGAPLPIPQGDLIVLAEYALERCRCAFFSEGHVPIVDVEPAELGGAA